MNLPHPSRKIETVDSNLLTDQIKEIIKNLKCGDKIYFNNIRGHNKKNQEVEIGDLGIIIIE